MPSATCITIQRMLFVSCQPYVRMVSSLFCAFLVVVISFLHHLHPVSLIFITCHKTVKKKKCLWKRVTDTKALSTKPVTFTWSTKKKDNRQSSCFSPERKQWMQRSRKQPNNSWRKKKQRYYLESSWECFDGKKSRVTLYLMQGFEKKKRITWKTKILGKIKAVSAQNGHKSCKRQKWNEMRKKKKRRTPNSVMFHRREKEHRWWSWAKVHAVLRHHEDETWFKREREWKITHINFFPLTDVTNQSWQTKESKKGKKFGKPEYSKGSTGVKYLKVVTVVLIEDQEDVVQRNGTDKIQEKPTSHVLLTDELGI